MIGVKLLHTSEQASSTALEEIGWAMAVLAPWWRYPRGGGVQEASNVSSAVDGIMEGCSTYEPAVGKTRLEVAKCEGGGQTERKEVWVLAQVGREDVIFARGPSVVFCMGDANTWSTLRFRRRFTVLRWSVNHHSLNRKDGHCGSRQALFSTFMLCQRSRTGQPLTHMQDFDAREANVVLVLHLQHNDHQQMKQPSPLSHLPRDLPHPTSLRGSLGQRH
jgi:hypothetical protein